MIKPARRQLRMLPRSVMLALWQQTVIVTIQLSRDEALVLFEWLHRCEDEDGVSPTDVALR
ncbi:hypothetical protein KZZ52_14215 [Dactylosporangium sp. AC04546]|uniref:hypothetical protein n=1 Tax=Dactylosporangium sp. AC04546 TaxID=2862460 RepID=UPI001EDD13E5|nr:hypothetical protein [Dactylosporangium sp. AC04546]WVK86476.1 hypothetical protein KZZ52_14215 [Dactylosporangium sp. AC04546]